MNQNLLKPLASAAFLLAASFSAFGCGAELEDGARDSEGLQETRQALLSSQELRSGVLADRCLDVSGAGTTPGTNVQIYTCNGSNAQKWTQTSANELRSALAPNLCLDVSGGSPTPGTNVQVYTCNGTAAQRWVETSRGEFRSALADNLCLDVAGAGTAPGTNVGIYACNNSIAQQWFHVPKRPVTNPGSVPITITRAVFGNGTNQAVRVARGQTLQLTVDYTIEQNSACPSCIDQILIGIPSEAQAQACAYDGIPSLSGTSGTSTVTLTAPSAPGVYYVRFRYAQALSCNLNWWTVNGVPGEQFDIAVISVL